MIRSFAVAFAVLATASSVWALDWPETHTRTVVLHNACDKEYAILVTYSPQKDVWEKAGWFTLTAGQRTRPLYKGRALMHRDSATIYMFAKSTDGEQIVKGDHGTNFDGEHYKSFPANRLLRGDIVELRLRC